MHVIHYPALFPEKFCTS